MVDTNTKNELTLEEIAQLLEKTSKWSTETSNYAAFYDSVDHLGIIENSINLQIVATIHDHFLFSGYSISICDTHNRLIAGYTKPKKKVKDVYDLAVKKCREYAIKWRGEQEQIRNNSIQQLKKWPEGEQNKEE